MDWTMIITTLITALIPTGGLVAIITMRERKAAMQIDNQKSIAESYKKLADEYRDREAKTQDLLMSKETELMSQIKLNSSLRRNLDDAHTETAVCKLMYCRNSKCTQRDPPYGSGANIIVRQLKDQSHHVYYDNNPQQQVINNELEQ